MWDARHRSSVIGDMNARWGRRAGAFLAMVAAMTVLAAGGGPIRTAEAPAGGRGGGVGFERRIVVSDSSLTATAGGLFIGVLGAPAQAPATSPSPLPACTYNDVPAARTGYDNWPRTLVDTTFALPRSYVPPDLVSVSRAGIAGGGQVRAIVIDDLRAMARAARRAGAPLAVRSAYRSYRRQEAVFGGWVATSGRDQAIRFSARPGHSEHQLGTAVDLQALGGVAPWQVDFGATRQGRWVARNAWRYGFVVSYPPDSEALVCYGAEAWHVRYVGRAVARDVHDSGLTLREWLWLDGH
jgi:zinc D-Ala-D-Ala carboxypeptidase